ERLPDRRGPRRHSLPPALGTDPMLPLPSTESAHELALRLVHADAEVRRVAVMELPYSDEDDILPLLLRAIRDADGAVRAAAAGAMEGFEEHEAVSALLGRLSDTHEDARRAAADTLAELKDDGNGALLLGHVASPDAF